MLDITVINCWGAPGVGKSTAAAGLFNLLKSMGVRVELVTEYAKELTYERNLMGLQNQLAILGEQDKRLRRLDGKVDFVITDSPLPLGIAYLTPEYEDMGLRETIRAAYERYHNIDFLIKRVKPYQAWGRNQTEFEALTLDVTIMSLFREATGWDGEAADEDNEAYHVPGDEWAPYAIAKYLPIPSLETYLAA